MPHFDPPCSLPQFSKTPHVSYSTAQHRTAQHHTAQHRMLSPVEFLRGFNLEIKATPFLLKFSSENNLTRTQAGIDGATGIRRSRITSSAFIKSVDDRYKQH